LKFTEQQVISMSPDDASLKAGRSLSGKANWLVASTTDRALWGEIKGSGSKPYQTQVDIQNLAFKCSCPSRKFPCKHGLGLLLLSANDAEAIAIVNSEPPWVEEWISKRSAKIEKEDIPKEYTDQELEKLEKGKQKRADDRKTQVDAGVEELNLWIQDIVKYGLLALKHKEAIFFDRAAARMIDAKASGLASYIRSLKNIDYSKNDFHYQVMDIMTKLYLLIQSYKNLDKLDDDMKLSIMNQVGWSQSPKELLADENTELIKDKWLVTGQEIDEVDDIVVHRIWLYGADTHQVALILNFGTRFAPLEITIMPTSVIEAAVVFFPGIVKQRAVIKIQKSVLSHLNALPDFSHAHNTILEVVEYTAERLIHYPLLYEHGVWIKNIKIDEIKGANYIIDSLGYIFEVSNTMAENTILNWYALNLDGPKLTFGIVRNNAFVGLGLFDDDKYYAL
jgi:hypothetical protein